MFPLALLFQTRIPKQVTRLLREPLHEKRRYVKLELGPTLPAGPSGEISAISGICLFAHLHVPGRSIRLPLAPSTERK
jgi:hypothetical protein